VQSLRRRDFLIVGNVEAGSTSLEPVKWDRGGDTAGGRQRLGGDADAAVILMAAHPTSGREEKRKTVYWQEAIRDGLGGGPCSKGFLWVVRLRC